MEYRAGATPRKPAAARKMKIFRIRITSPTLSRWLLLLTSKAAISVPSKTAPPRIASPIPAPIKNPPKTAVNNLSGAEFHNEIAKRLSSVRDEDVLIVGSGNLV